MLKQLMLASFLVIIILGCTTNISTCENEVVFKNWSDCNGGIQARIKMVFDCNNGSLIYEGIEKQDCVMPCVSNWSCTEWSECPKEENQFRSCTDLNNCFNDSDSLNITNGPNSTQKCVFNNPCLNISDSKMKEECNSLVYNSNKYCYNITESLSSESCLYSYAYIYSNFNTCDLINTSASRNTCKAVINLDKSYCNILPPDNRSDCNYEVDLRYQYLAITYSNPSFCNSIQSSNVKSNCLSNSGIYETYRDDMNDCKTFSFVNSSSNYQSSTACYIYHIKNSENSSVCNDVGYFIRDDCNALIQNNLSFCYDKSGSERDWCLANFAYFYNNIRICRDAANEENCIYTVGYWFKEIDYCLAIKDTSKNSACINSYVNYCEENINNCPSINYCSLITDSNSKNTCILKKVKNEIKFNNKVW
ncbi:MAG: hypothetical protein WC393_02495 [Candidatus Nanoarchaeia archaeon]